MLHSNVLSKQRGVDVKNDGLQGLNNIIFNLQYMAQSETVSSFQFTKRETSTPLVGHTTGKYCSRELFH